ncbi:MAG: flavin reductase family protein [Candidatus Marinimicrobia bacterium]|nr:flavin reductase family protein [Candidatus Neomarinimicrobiota bacterium]
MNYKAFLKIGYGMYIVSSKSGEKYNGQIANAVMQVSAEPPTFAIGINKNNLTHKYIIDSKYFSVSILSEETDMKFIGKFGFKSGRDNDKFADVDFEVSENKIPAILEKSVAYFICKVIDEVDVGSHTLFIGEAVETKILNDKTPLTYKYYHEVLKGKSPKSAPTFIKKENLN